MDENQKKSSISPRKKRDPEIRTLLKTDDVNIQYGGISQKDDDIPLLDSDRTDKTMVTRAFEYMVTLTIEPLMFCFMFAFLMNLSVLPNMLMDKACLHYFNYSKEVCDNLTSPSYTTEKQNVEKLTTTYSLYANLTSLFAAFMMTFIAPWSDKYGRKLPLLVSIFGAILTDIGLILCATYFESSLLYIVAARLPSEIFGGFICMLTIIFSHASEVSTESSRTLKYTTVEVALALGLSFGSLTGGFLYRYYGYVCVFVTVAGVHLFCAVWLLLVVEETTGLDVDMKWHEKARDFFTCESFKSNVKAAFKKREGNTRMLLLFLLASTCMIILNYEAFGTIGYVYVHDVYDWDPTVYGVVNTSNGIFGMFVILITVPLLVKVLKLQDFTLGIIGTLSMMGKNLCIAFSKHHTSVYYMGLVIGVYSTLGSLAVRSGISKLVEKEELGRVFSFLATCEAIIPMLGTVAVTQIFNATMNVFPNVTYTVGVSLLLLPLGTFIWASKHSKNSFNQLSAPINENTKGKV